MKPLPNPPEPYKLTSEQWYLAHTPAKKLDGNWNLNRKEIAKTYAAMQCVLENANVKKGKVVAPIDSSTIKLVSDCIQKHGENLMFVWQKLCSKNDKSKCSINGLLVMLATTESEQVI